MNDHMNETSKFPYQVTLSDKGWNGLQTIAKSLGLSVSKLLEKVGSNQMVMLDVEELEDLLDTIDGFEGLVAAEEESIS